MAVHRRRPTASQPMRSQHLLVESSRPVKRLARVASLLLIGALCLAFGAACSLPFGTDGDDSANTVKDLSTSTASDEFATAEERVAFASDYLRFRGPVEDVHFTINYIDNSTDRVPGPSDWYMQFVLEVPPETTERWIEEATPIDSLDIEWAEEWLSDLAPQSQPTHVQRAGSRVTIFPEDGIVAMLVATEF